MADANDRLDSLDARAAGGERGMALITGASSGIGSIYADRLAQRGYDLVLVARDEDRLTALSRELEARYGVRAAVLVADLTLPDQLARVERRIREEPRLAVLINNAGNAYPKGLLEGDIELHQFSMNLNVVAVTRLAASAAKPLAARGRGAIVNISSVLALMTDRPDDTVYSAAKAFVLAMSEALSVELKDHGVVVQAVLPGATRTEIWQRAGIDIASIDPAMLMDAGDLVDAALFGLEMGETVTIPALGKIELWHAFVAARSALAPHLSLSKPAARYLEA